MLVPDDCGCAAKYYSQCTLALSQFRMKCNAIRRGWWKYSAASFISSRFYLLLSGRCKGTPSWHLKSEAKNGEYANAGSGDRTSRRLHHSISCTNWVHLHLVTSDIPYISRIRSCSQHAWSMWSQLGETVDILLLWSVTMEANRLIPFAPNAGRRHIA